MVEAKTFSHCYDTPADHSTVPPGKIVGLRIADGDNTLYGVECNQANNGGSFGILVPVEQSPGRAKVIMTKQSFIPRGGIIIEPINKETVLVVRHLPDTPPKPNGSTG